MNDSAFELAAADCVVSNTVEENDHALQQIRQVLKGDISASTDLDSDALQATVRTV